MSQFKRGQGGDQQRQQRQLKSIPWLDGKMCPGDDGLREFQLNFTANSIRKVMHGLGRRPKGFITLDIFCTVPGGTPLVGLDRTDQFIELENSSGRTLCAKVWVW